jgi:hypothetical protein
MRMWIMAMGVAMVGFNLMVAVGWLDAGKSIYGGPRFVWLSALVGGAMFGFGMVLASGCGSKTLVRIGGGNLKSLVVFIALGVSAFATLKGITAVARVATVDSVAVTFATGQDLPSLLSAGTGVAKTTLWYWVGPSCSGRWRVPKAAVPTTCSPASASAPWSSACGGCRAAWAMSPKIRARCKRRLRRPTRGAWSRSASSRRWRTRWTG